VEQKSRPQRSYADPCAGGQLEVFVQAAVEPQTQLRIIGVDPPHGITEAVVTFLIE
jgi:hypothetical protein